MKWIDKVLDDRNEGAIAFFWQLVGPLFILCTFALAPQNYFIFSAGVIGLFLSAKYRNPGFIASVILLVAIAALEHHYSAPDHFFSTPFKLWSLGLISSYAMAFFITAQSAARHQTFVRSVFSQLETKNSFATTLEEECHKTRLEITELQVKAQEKIDLLQKQLEEIQAEQSSLLMLNEVLRKTTANHMQKKDSLTEELYQLQSRLAVELSEKEALKSMLSTTESEQKQLLLEELNAVKQEKEQTHTLKETLERLHNYEQQRAHTAYAQISMIELEKTELSQKMILMESELEQARLNVELEKERLATIVSEKNETILNLENKLEQTFVQFKEQLSASESEKSELLAQKEKETIIPLERELTILRTQLEDQRAEKAQLEKTIDALKQEKPTNTELLYKQLREQFEEKNAILHQTRSELFKIDNAYQALQIEVTQIDMGVPSQVILELEKELNSLQVENQDLQTIITTLSEPEAKVKKKSE